MLEPVLEPEVTPDKNMFARESFKEKVKKGSNITLFHKYLLWFTQHEFVDKEAEEVKEAIVYPKELTFEHKKRVPSWGKGKTGMKDKLEKAEKAEAEAAVKEGEDKEMLNLEEEEQKAPIPEVKDEVKEPEEELKSIFTATKDYNEGKRIHRLESVKTVKGLVFEQQSETMRKSPSKDQALIEREQPKQITPPPS